MPIPIPEAIAEAGDVAAAKSTQVRSLGRYLLSALLGGAYVGVAVVLLITVSAPLAAAGSPFAKLVQGGVFGIALILVVFAGAELFTGNAMVMLQGLATRRVRSRDLAAVWGASLFGNLVGSLGFAALVHGGGTLGTGPAAELVGTITTAKAATAGPQLFWRAVLCNLLVCLALWMASRTRSEVAKIMVLWFALLAFIGSGFEHSIANMTILGLGVLQGTVEWADFGRNLLWTIPGNVVGGGLIVGLGYAWIGRAAPAPAATAVAADPEPALAYAPAAPSGSAPELELALATSSYPTSA
ncbi:MAG: formate/nitrite transporter family protein [Acidimicrobiia bacterium]|nr:formate/nitrite transporter family protein [Acidimicrobiia bacterium]